VVLQVLLSSSSFESLLKKAEITDPVWRIIGVQVTGGKVGRVCSLGPKDRMQIEMGHKKIGGLRDPSAQKWKKCWGFKEGPRDEEDLKQNTRGKSSSENAQNPINRN